MPHIINTEPNNNTITTLTTPITGKLDTEQIGTNDSKILVRSNSKKLHDNQVNNVGGLKGVYIQNDKYRPFTIFGKFFLFVRGPKFVISPFSNIK